MGKISKTGIAPQQQIKAEHITRIIDALSGETSSTQIEISGSVTASYFVGDGSRLTNLPIPSGSGGGGSIDTGSFAITGSNTFIGDQFISGNITMASDGIIQIGNEFDGITLGGSGFEVYRNNYTSQIIINPNSFTVSNNDNGISFNITSGSTPYHYISSNTQGRTNFFQHPLQSGGINLNYPSQSGILVTEDKINRRITRSQAELMFSSSLFIPGLNYTITDADVNLYGGTEITLTAITSNELSLQGSGKFYCPKYDVSAEGTGYGIWTKQMEGTFSNITGSFTPGNEVSSQNGAKAIYLAEGFLEYISGDWSLATSIEEVTGLTADVSGFISPSYTIGKVVHWGGKSWTNNNGNIGESIDKYTLDAEWTEIPFNETDYNVYVDEIQYDFDNDMIIYRKDRYNNVVGGSNQVFAKFQSPDGYGYGNPIKDFQWGCMQDNFNTNDYFYLGVQGNEVINSYFETLNTRGRYIWFNKLSQICHIRNNTLSIYSYIQSNTLSIYSYIENNTLSSNSSIQNNILSDYGYINYNTLSNSYIRNNTLNNNSSIQYNALSNSYIRNNTLNNNSSIRYNALSNSYIRNNTLNNNSSIQNNTLKSNSSIQNNTLSSNSSIQNNTLKSNSSIQYTTLSSNSSIRNNTLSNSSIQYTTLNNSSILIFSNEIISQIVAYLEIRNSNVSIPNTATIIFNPNLSKTIFKRLDGTPRLQYINNSDVIVITDVNT